MKKITFEEEIPGRLEKMDKRLPFRIPDHYFEDFQSRLRARMETEELHLPEKRITLIRYLKPALGLAAAFAAVFLLVFYPVRLITKQNTFAQTELSGEEENIINLIEYVDDHTFFNLLVDDSQESKMEGQELEVYIASNYSDLDIYLETQK
jgi:hypothetical protein